MELIKVKDFKTLQAYDQLLKEMQEQRVLNGFEEIVPNFRPTYRFVRYDMDEKGERLYNDEKQRVPSWCDRILWRCQPGFHLKPTSFGSTERVSSSDHCPVYASFELGARMQPTTVASLSANDNTLVPGQAKLILGDLVANIYSSMNGQPPNTFIKFCAPFLRHSLKVGTKVVKKTDNPRWGTINPLLFIINEKEYIMSSHIICILINDLGVTEKVPMGCCVLPLNQACGPTPQLFSLPIEYRGKEVGYLAGTVYVEGLVSVKSEGLWKRIEEISVN